MEAKFDFIRYSNCWEDSENLLKALEIQGQRGASILSAGDNTLAMLLGDPESITAFDINPTQIHLFYLKKAGFEMLSHGDLLALLGIGGTDRSWELFQSLEPVMDPEAFQYFFGHPEFFEKGIVHIGKFERYFQIFRNRVVPLFTTKRKMAKLAEFHDVEAQKKYYDRWVNNRRMNAIFKVFFGFRMMGKLGRDRAFYNYVEDKENSAVNIKKTADSGMGRIPNWNNPYMTYVLTNRFTEDALPYYLQEQFHETIRNRLDRIEIKRGTLQELTGKYGFFNLSDIFEYMSEEQFEENIQTLRELSAPGARVAYYNMQNRRYLPETGFHFLKELSERQTQATKSYFYRDFVVYEIGENK